MNEFDPQQVPPAGEQSSPPPPVSPLDDEHDAPEPYWNTRRIVLTIIVIITLIAFLAYTFSGLFQPPIRLPELPPPPTSAV